MASGRTCVLLLRAVALGGLTAAAWLISGAIASASPADTPVVPVVPEITTQILNPEPADTSKPADTPEAPKPQLLADPAGWAVSLTVDLAPKAQTHARPDRHKPERHKPVQIDVQDVKPDKPSRPGKGNRKPVQTEPEDDGPTYDYSGGSSSGERSGSYSNTAPPQVIAAKAEARAARKAAKLAAMAPPPAAPVAVAPAVPVQPPAPTPAPQAPVEKKDTIETGADWTVPQPTNPIPVPQPAPVATGASVSSGHHDNSGGARGVLAVLASHSALFPPTTWTVEERRDGRSPGSLPGLPSTSPD